MQLPGQGSHDGVTLACEQPWEDEPEPPLTPPPPPPLRCSEAASHNNILTPAFAGAAVASQITSDQGQVCKNAEPLRGCAACSCATCSCATCSYVACIFSTSPFSLTGDSAGGPRGGWLPKHAGAVSPSSSFIRHSARLVSSSLCMMGFQEAPPPSSPPFIIQFEVQYLS